MSYEARLQARPAQVQASAPTGRQALKLGSSRDSFLYVPAHYAAPQPLPLVLLLHGAGGHAHHGLDLLQHLADESGLILLAPASIAHTWDVIAYSAYGSDVALIDQALAYVFHRYAIDTSHLAIGGFSDGASYALSLGLANGDLFTHVIAFSPGFVAPISPHGQPRIFITHGTRDDVLPIDACSRRIVPLLRRAEYDVAYEEFDGPHTLPAETAQRAVTWFMQP